MTLAPLIPLLVKLSIMLSVIAIGLRATFNGRPLKLSRAETRRCSRSYFSRVERVPGRPIYELGESSRCRRGFRKASPGLAKQTTHSATKNPHRKILIPPDLVRKSPLLT